MERPRNDQAYLVFILLLSLFALALLAAETLFQPDAQTLQIIESVDTVVCVLFFADFLHSLYTARGHRWRYLYTWGWLDLLSSIPIVEPLRAARAARVIRILRILRGIRATRILTMFIVQKRGQSMLLTALLLTLLLIAVSSIAILHAESGEGGNIRTAADALWWSTATITTVGYGDLYPVTAEGRLIAILMMAFGVSLFAILSGLFASWFLQPGEQHQDKELGQIREELESIKAMLAAHQDVRAEKEVPPD